MARLLVRTVSSGTAEIHEWQGGQFGLKVSLDDLVRARVEYGETFDDLSEAANAAEHFKWAITELAGQKWYCTREGKEWVAVIGEGDVATVALYGDDGAYSIKRTLCPRYGESYELSAHRYDSAVGKHSVTTFSEAAAIATTLPAFVAVLGGANQ
ncbi:hypothetical protein CFM90_26375 (plasmid) [Ralstonia solanacearum]|nr:hypothetical protein CFM90_26375 [Ralstonia solanacearum]